MRRSAYLCGVPPEKCCGSHANKQKAIPEKSKVHGGRDQAFRCMVSYLKGEGYEQIGSREFRPSGGGPIRVLTRPGKFGGRLRYCPEKTRFMNQSKHAVVSY